MGRETDLILLNFSSQKAQTTTMCSQIYDRNVMDSTKGFFILTLDHLQVDEHRYWSGSRVTKIIMLCQKDSITSPNCSRTKWAFRLDLYCPSCSGILIWLKVLTTAAAASSPRSWASIPQMGLSAKNAAPPCLHTSALSRKSPALWHSSS